MTAVERHMHTGMRELIRNLSQDPLDLVLQKTPEADEEVVTLETGDTYIVPTRRLHVIRNSTHEEIKFLAMGIRTSEEGKTVQV